MTIPGYGRVTPLQSDVLALAGEVDQWLSRSPTDEERMNGMREARRFLRDSTGRDFGYDLGAWHAFLLASPEHSEEYTFSYAWTPVKSKIEKLIADPDRLRLVDMLEMREKS